MVRMLMDMLQESAEEVCCSESMSDPPAVKTRAVVRLLFLEASPYDLSLNQMLTQEPTARVDLWRSRDLAHAGLLLDRHPFDLFMLDLSQPGGPKFDDVRRFAADHPQLPILGLIKNGADRADAQEAGCSWCLIKPLMTLKAFDRAVRHLVSEYAMEPTCGGR